MGELVGSSETFSTWGKFRAPLGNPDNYYGWVWTAEFPVWFGSEHTKTYNAGQFCYTEITYCYPPGWWVSEHGSMFRVIPYSGFGWFGAYVSFWPTFSEVNSPYGNWYYGDPMFFQFYVDQRDQLEMEGATLTSDAGLSVQLQEEAFTSGQAYDLFGETTGTGWYQIEKLTPIT